MTGDANLREEVNSNSPLKVFILDNQFGTFVQVR
jgi:hypothetical protein